MKRNCASLEGLNGNFLNRVQKKVNKWNWKIDSNLKLSIMNNFFADKCFVCRQEFTSLAFEVGDTAEYSNKTVQELIGKISIFIKRTETEYFFIIELIAGIKVDSVAVCPDCKCEIDSFDKHYTKAMVLKEKLYKLIKYASEIMSIKSEVIKDELLVIEDFGMPHIDATPEVIVDEIREQSLERDSMVAGATSKLTSYAKAKLSKPAVQCTVCSKIFCTIYVLRKHMKLHNSELKHKCPTCSKHYTSQEYLKEHMKLHDEKRKFFCDRCGSHFKTKVSISRHIKAHHTTSREFLCTQCPKAYPYLAGLITHLRTHSDDKKECCPTCGDRFHTKDKLRRHERIHSTEREFKCPICAQEFKQKYNVNAHIKAVHLKQKDKWSGMKFECNICGSKFDRDGKLKKHLSKVHEVVAAEEAGS